MNQTRPPTSTARSAPTMMNQSTGRTGRLGALLSIGSPEILCSVTMFMSCTLCNRRLSHTRCLIAAQMRGNCGVVKSDTPQDKLTELPLEVVRLAVSETRRGRQPGQRSRHHGVMRKPEQVERFAVDLCASPAATARSSEATKAGPIRPPILAYSRRANSPSSNDSWSSVAGAAPPPGPARPAMCIKCPTMPLDQFHQRSGRRLTFEQIRAPGPPRIRPREFRRTARPWTGNA